MSLKFTCESEKIKHLSHSRSIHAQPKTPLKDVLEKMRTEKSAIALIVDSHQKLVGVFTERDVLLKVLGKGLDLTQPIENFMTPKPFYLDGENSVGEALEMMVKNKIRHIPIVDPKKNTVEGQVDVLNLVQFLVEHFPYVYNLPPKPNQQLNLPEGA
ncbi:MAG: CBS domain-containing protein [Planctomycetota bacterium]